jgi:hypothetical protein
MNSNIFTRKISIFAIVTTLTIGLILAPFLGAVQAAKPTGEGGNPHFVGRTALTANPNDSITATFKIAGLQAGQTVQATLAASSVSVTGQCVNPGGNSPPPKTFSVGGLSETATLGPVPKNGNLQGSVTLGPPSQEQIVEAADCPNPNWSVAVSSIVYSGVTLSIITQQGALPTQNLGTIST